jgi:hypothetical protein
MVAYAEPQRSFGRRVISRLFSAPIIIPVVFLGAIAIGILVYYWTVFSGRIDNLLKGEVFTRTAGIYAAPKQAILLVVSRLGLSIFKTHAWQGGPVSFGALSLVAAWLQWQGVETDDG